jgi:hypothetical protein
VLVVGAEEGGHLGALPEVSCDAFECRHMDDDVRIEEDQNIAVRQSGSAIPRHRRAVGTPGQRDELDAEAMCQRRCPVGRSVIDD